MRKKIIGAVLTFLGTFFLLGCSDSIEEDEKRMDERYEKCLAAGGNFELDEDDVDDKWSCTLPPK